MLATNRSGPRLSGLPAVNAGRELTNTAMSGTCAKNVRRRTQGLWYANAEFQGSLFIDTPLARPSAISHSDSGSHTTGSPAVIVMRINRGGKGPWGTKDPPMRSE